MGHTVYVSYILYIYCIYLYIIGPDTSHVKALDYGLDGPGWIPDGRGVEIFSVLRVQTVPGSTEPPVK